MSALTKPSRTPSPRPASRPCVRAARRWRRLSRSRPAWSVRRWPTCRARPTVLRGGLAAYASDVKSTVLGVDPALIDRHGVVSRRVCRGDGGVRHSTVRRPTGRWRRRGSPARPSRTDDRSARCSSPWHGPAGESESVRSLSAATARQIRRPQRGRRPRAASRSRSDLSSRRAG